MEKIVVEVYKFEELGEDAQAKAIEAFADINVDHDWYEWTLNDFVNHLHGQGFTDANINFSGFCSQGDGASFVSGIDIYKLNDYYQLGLKKRVMDIINEYVEPSIERTNHHYSHKYTCSTIMNYGKLYDLTAKQVQKIHDIIEDIRLNRCNEIYEALEKEYDYLTSTEAIKETIIANEYNFSIDGSRSVVL